ncbi:MAG: HDOD domain-containing protein [Burkholderiales bacterium]|nr:HDOD domain-containing protein [Burkholderiales bacterium]
MTNSPPPASVNKTNTGARDRILEQVKADQNLPTLGVAIAKVVEITSSGEDSVADLAHFILSDVALTQRVLRLSNTVNYRTASGVAVTTISRAIFLLGFDTIKANALASLLVDGFRSQKQALAVRKELMLALCASVMAREIAKNSHHPGHEEAAVAALFKNMGRILVASFDHQLYEQIQSQSQADTQTSPSSANDPCLHLLGCSFERLGAQVLHDWKIPDTIIHAIQSVSGEQKKSKLQAEWLRQVSSFAASIALHVILPNRIQQEEQLMRQCSSLLLQFGSALDIDRAQLAHILRQVDREVKQLAISLEVPLDDNQKQSSNEHQVIDDFCKEFGLAARETHQIQASARHPSGKPINARELLLAGIQDATQMLSSPQLKLNDLLLLVLETLYGAMGFRFATACLRDPQEGKYLARLSVGDNYQERQRNFQLSASGEENIFLLAMNNNVDLMIADAHNPKIQTMLPAWHKTHHRDCRSFIVLPLVIDKKNLGFFYADRARTAEEGVPSDETALIKTLKGQLLSAMLRV